MHSDLVFNQLSHGIASDRVKAWITEAGGHMAPVVFSLASGPVEPFSVAPWSDEFHDIPTILQVLRGDFFCLPFGGNEKPYGSETYPIHGETANRNWTLVNHGLDFLEMRMETKIRPGVVDKRVWVKPGQTAIYQRHTISDMCGPMCFGQHAMVKFKSKGQVSVSPFGFGQVFPDQFENPILGGYSSLQPGAHFDQLDKVPANDGTTADLSVYPVREGFEDLAMVYAQRGSEFAWSAVVFPDEQYIWFSLKDPRVLSGTILWHSNGGRHYAPWSGRHRQVLGIEEVTSYMHYGLEGSVKANEASMAGYRTYFDLEENSSLVVNSIIGVVGCGFGAGKVEDISIIEGGIVIRMTNGERITVQIDIFELYVKAS